jgi:hypothetical protein
MDQNPYAPPEAELSGVAPESSGLPPGTRLYVPGQTFAAALLGGPLAAAWLFRENYRAFGKDRSATQSIWIGVGATVALAALGFVLPERFPGLVLPIAYSLAIRYYAKQIFGQSIDRHVAGGGLRGSWWTVLGIALACVLAMLAVLFAVSLVWFHATGQ